MPDRSKTILVTGATGGIGEAICHRLAEKGNSLVLVARSETNLERLRCQLPLLDGASHRWIVADMTSDASLSNFATRLAEDEGVLDGVVLMPPQPHRSNNPLPENSEWTALFQDSFIGPLNLLKIAIDRMRPDPQNGRRAKIVIISGITSAQVLGHYATSNVLRLAWIGQAKTMAFALGPKGIHINTLSLGGTLSPWYRASIESRAAAAGISYDEQVAKETENVPLGKYGQPAEVAAAVEGLLSDFSDHITGTNLLHDGGFTRAY